jgi:benzoyl-CoA 2,3-dioxygenase component B
MKRDPNEDARAQGGLDLPLLQRFINHWYSESLDLFGSPDSSNAASYFATGLKGRYQESKSGLYPDHTLVEGAYPIERPGAHGVETQEVAPRRATNAMLQDSYTRECEKSLGHWNQALASAGLSQRLALPSPRFNRKIGPFAESHWLPSGAPAADRGGVAAHLPNAADVAWLEALQDGPVLARGQCASWIAAPTHKINGQTLDFEYVRFA